MVAVQARTVQARTVQALSFGPEAVAAREGACRLLGVTSKAVYLQTRDDSVLAVVGAGSPDGPLSIRVPHFRQIARSLEQSPPEEIRLEQGALCFGDLLRVSLAPDRLWSPTLPRVAVPGIGPVLLHAIADALSEQASQEGAAPLALALADSDMSRLRSISRQESHPVAARIARHLLGATPVMLDGDNDRASQLLAGVLGVGPGLTPSGDDFLSGLLAVLHWQTADTSLTSFALRLAGEVLLEAPTRTNGISAALLRYSAGGVLYAPAMELGSALGRGSAADARAATLRLLNVGATSGADTATGILAGLLVARLTITT